MDLSGTWKPFKLEDADKMMRKIGMPEEEISAVINLHSALVIEMNGSDEMVEDFVMAGKSSKSVIHIGKKTEVTQWDENIVEAIPVKIADNKYSIEYDYKGHHYVLTREITTGDVLLDTIAVSEGGETVVGKFHYKKND